MRNLKKNEEFGPVSLSHPLLLDANANILRHAYSNYEYI